jgi:hypothetical protein
MYSRSLDVEFDAATFPGGLLPAGFKVGPVLIDMGAALLMLGSMTVPNGFSIASPATHWAWVRYFTALGPQPDLRVTTPFSDLDPHQVGILSDDFGVAVTTQWLFGQVTGFKQVVDGRRFILQYAHLLTQAAPQPAKIGSGKSPDFVVLDNMGKWHVKLLALVDRIWWLEPDSNRRRFLALEKSIRQLFSRYIRPLWGPRFSAFPKGPKQAPKSVRLYANDPGRPRPMKRCFSISFPRVTCFLSGIPDISGRPGKSAEVGRLDTAFSV